jgi:hypothetical protein
MLRNYRSRQGGLSAERNLDGWAQTTHLRMSSVDRLPPPALVAFEPSSLPRVAAHVLATSIGGLDHMRLRGIANGTGCGFLVVPCVRLHGCEEQICATWWMLKQTKYVAGAGVLTALGAIAPLWVWFQGDLLGAAIIAIPSALVLAIGFGVTWAFLQE